MIGPPCDDLPVTWTVFWSARYCGLRYSAESSAVAAALGGHNTKSQPPFVKGGRTVHRVVRNASLLQLIGACLVVAGLKRSGLCDGKRA
jgi:hypothetical protein